MIVLNIAVFIIWSIACYTVGFTLGFIAGKKYASRRKK